MWFDAMETINTDLDINKINFEIGDEYYYISDKGRIAKDMWFNNFTDQYRLKCNNVYKTYRQIKVIAKRIKKDCA